MIAQSGDLGVAGYVSQNYADGAIGYVNYSYALNDHFPVVKLLNSAGYYTEPTPQNVAVSLLQAQVDTTDVNDPSLYLTQKLGSVYTDGDPRTYELSSYSYFILPTTVQGQFSTAKGKTLAAFSYYAMCQGQQESAALGYSPMPVNLVQASFDQIKKIPGAVVQNISIQSCNNPTFSPTSPNLLAQTAPQPQGCDKQGPTQCSSGTGGASKTSTANSSGSGGSGSSSGSSGSGSGSGSGRSTGRGGSAAVAGATGASVGRGGSSTGTGGSRSSGGAGGTGTGTSGAGSAGSGSAASAACDPSTGNCSSNDPTQANNTGNSSSGSQSAAATPYTVATAKGWSGTQTLMLLIAVLLLGLVVAPGITARWLAKRDQ
jgi:phosphate transport system substrate-binding protein